MDDVKGEGMIQRTTEYSSSTAGSVMGTTHVAEGSSPITEDVIFLEPGQEKAQNIVKAISHQNAGDVMQILSLEGPLRLSDISERLGMSLNAAKYHIENLMNAGLLEIANTRYSVKGKKVKIYRLKNQVFIVAPKMNGIAQVRSALLKYSAALGVFIMVFSIVLVQPFVLLPAVPLHLSGSIQPGQPVPVMTDTGVIPALIIATAVTLILLVLYELYINLKNPPSLFNSSRKQS
jgi:DNA-binding transcriptional ArsR family regulator